MELRVKRYGPLSTMVVVGRLVGTFEPVLVIVTIAEATSTSARIREIDNPRRHLRRNASTIAAEKAAEWRGCGEVMRLPSTTTGASCTQVAPAASASGCTTKSGKETPSLKPVMRRPATTFERAANIDPRQIQAMTPPRALTSCTNLLTQGSSASKAGLLAPPGIRIPT